VSAGDSPESVYDAFADWYAAHALAGNWVQWVILRHLEALTGDVTNRVILDLACGEGIYTRILRKRGANATGVDLSGALLQLARQRDPDHADAYLCDDARHLSSLPAAAFDGVSCMMALMDIPDLEMVFRAVHRVVHPSGWFVVAITHPCFETPHASWVEHETGMVRTVNRYLDEGEWRSRNAEGVRSRAGAMHRTVSTYLNTANDTGWTLERLIEPPNNKPDDPTPDIPRLMMIRFRRTDEEATVEAGAIEDLRKALEEGEASGPAAPLDLDAFHVARHAGRPCP